MNSEWEKLIIPVIIAVGAVIQNIMKKRREAEQARSDAAQRSALEGRPAPSGPPPAPARADWEEQLRRLLEGEVPATPPPRPPAAPSPSRPMPSPIRPVIISTPPTIPRPVQQPPPIRPTIILPPVSSPRSPTPLAVPTVTGLASRDLATMDESRKAYERGSQLSQQTALHIQQVPSLKVMPTSVLRSKTVSPDLAQSLAVFRNPHTARQAVVAALILGPPVAMD